MLYTVKSYIFVGLNFRGFEFNNELVDIKFRGFLMCRKTKIRLFRQKKKPQLIPDITYILCTLNTLIKRVSQDRGL